MNDKTKNLSFSSALNALEEGKKVAREGWNCDDMWLTTSCLGEREVAAGNFWSPHNSEFASSQGGTAIVCPCITMKTADDKIQMGWIPSQLDMFAKDWCIIS